MNQINLFVYTCFHYLTQFFLAFKCSCSSILLFALFCCAGLDCLDRIAYKRDFATIKSRRNVAYLALEYYTTDDGKSLIYISNDHVSELLISMVFSKGFPLYEHVTDMLLQLKSTGFVYSNYNRFRNILKAKKTVPKLDSMSLNLDEVKGPFGLLVIGLGIAFFVFLMELVLFFIHKWVYRYRGRISPTLYPNELQMPYNRSITE